jgi:hypothetical protein
MTKPELDHSFKRRVKVLLPLAALTLATVLSVEFAGAQQAPQKGPPPATPGQLATFKSTALEFAQANGDANPTHGELVGATRAPAVALLMNGAGVDADANVYAVQLQGRFTGYQLPQPSGAPPLKGRFLTIVYDASTGDLLDWGISNQRHELTALGSPQALLP